MSARARVSLIVAALAAAAAGLVVALTLATRTDPVQPAPFQGKPPVPVGVPPPAGQQIEAAFRTWPNGSIDVMQRLGLTYPKSAIVQYYRGVALIWAGYEQDAVSALELAKRLGRDTYIQGKADNLLHPNYFQPTSPPYYPVFLPTERNRLLERGSLLQEEGHQESAEQLYREAVRRDPDDAQARVAAAVGLFDEDDLAATFSQLGPLSSRFPRSQAVHYYLAYLLAWTHQGADAIAQYRTTLRLGPTTELGRAAAEWLSAIAKAGAPAHAAA